MSNVKRMENIILLSVLFLTALICTIFSTNMILGAGVNGPSSINAYLNETSNSSISAKAINGSGGYVSTMNITTIMQNPRWKAFIGKISGRFTLEDAIGSTMYDWSIASVFGEVYATRNGSTINWNAISCAPTSVVESENTAMGLTNRYDNITRTFNSSSNPEFFVGSRNISLNSCSHTVNTYVNNVSQSTYFKEVVLNSSNSLIYAALLEQNTLGFDSNSYDFQMIVPERGTEGWSGSTAYYLYVEIT